MLDTILDELPQVMARGKFKNGEFVVESQQAKFQILLKALWFRGMYDGAVDAESLLKVEFAKKDDKSVSWRYLTKKREKLSQQISPNFDPRKIPDWNEKLEEEENDPTIQIIKRAYAERGKVEIDKGFTTMRLRQLYANLLDRFPEISPDSYFAQVYLERRTQVVAHKLDKRYQEAIKQSVAEYLKATKKSEKAFKKNLSTIYKEAEKARLVVVDFLDRKMNDMLVTPPEYIEYLKTLGSFSTAVPRLSDEEYDALSERANELQAKIDLAEDKKLVEAERKELKSILRTLRKSERAKEPEDPGNKNLRKIYLSALKKNQKVKQYVDPRKKVPFTDEEAAIVAKELGINPEQLKGKFFSFEQLANIKRTIYNERLDSYDRVNKFVDMVGNTELGVAYNLGRIATYIKRGVTHVQWISTLDSHTSVFCQSLHQKIFSLEDVVAGVTGVTQFPRTDLPEYHPINQRIKTKGGFATWLPGLAHPFCRSFFIPVYTKEQIDNLSTKLPTLPPDPRIAEIALDQLLDKRKSGRFSEKELDELIKKQRNIRKYYVEKLYESMGLFMQGLKYMFDRLSKSKDPKVKFKKEEILKNDQKLVNFLMSGSIILGVGSMMYFMLKSNLITAIKKASIKFFDIAPQISLEKIIEKMVIAEKRAQELPLSIQKFLIESGDPESLYLPADPDHIYLLDQIDLANQRGTALTELSMLGKPYREVRSHFIPETKPEAFARAIDREVISRVNVKISELRKNYDQFMTSAYSNAGGYIKLDDILEIEEWANVYKIKRKEGPPTFVSKKMFEQINNIPATKEFLDLHLEEISQYEKLLDELEAVMPKDAKDTIDQAMLEKTKLELKALKSLALPARRKLIGQKIKIKQPSQRVENLAKDTYIQEQLDKAVNAQTQYTEQWQKIMADYESYLPPKTLRENLIPENIISIKELKKAKKIFETALAKAPRRVMMKQRSLEKIAAKARKASDALNANGILYNLNIDETENHYRDLLDKSFEDMEDMIFRIERRIEELQNEPSV